VARLAAAPSAEAAPAGPLTLAAALALAARGNRRIAEAEEQLEVARARVWEMRGRLLPAPRRPRSSSARRSSGW